MTVLVCRERRTKMLLAAVVPKKGPDKRTALRVTNFVEELGCAHLDVITKSDREPAIRSLLREVSRMRAEVGGGRTIPEASPAHSSQSNGVAERGVQSAEAQIRGCAAPWRRSGRPCWRRRTKCSPRWWNIQNISSTSARWGTAATRRTSA